MQRRIVFPVRKFQALNSCPKCGEFGVFTIENPPEVDAVWESDDDDSEEIRSWGGDTVFTIHNTPRGYKTDKSTCDVVRTCYYCNARWGEK